MVSGPASFSNRRFSAQAHFEEATFSATADFDNTKFSEPVYFINAKFSAKADFRRAEFAKRAYFSQATFDGKAHFTNASFQQADFNRTTFSHADFDPATFSGLATFRDSKFETAHFMKARFSKLADFRSGSVSGQADFSNAEFADAYFVSAAFGAHAVFRSATFTGIGNFSSARFSADADFDLSVFHAQADFSRASFNDSIHFFGGATERLLEDGISLAAMALGKDPSLDFQFVRIEHPDRIAFHTLNLRPHWFVNVDCRSFVFTDVAWGWDSIGIRAEIESLKKKEIRSPYRLLSMTFRQLAINAMENNRYEESSRFHYLAMDVQRRASRFGHAFWKLEWWYWAASGYGRRLGRALVVLIGIWLAFALLYMHVGFARPQTIPNSDSDAAVVTRDEVGEPLTLPPALTYSLGVMSLQKPEPRAVTNAAHAFVTIETILSPIQAALLALVIRRRFSSDLSEP